MFPSLLDKRWVEKQQRKQTNGGSYYNIRNKAVQKLLFSLFKPHLLATRPKKPYQNTT